MALRFSFLAAGLAALTVVPVWAQDAAQQNAQSVVEAARNARDRRSESGKPPRVITSDDLPARSPSTASPAPVSAANAQFGPAPTGAGDCYDGAAAEAISNELHAAEEKRDELRSNVNSQAPVISNGDLDPEYFRPGNSGIHVGSLPLLEDRPEAAPRVELAALEERIRLLQKSLRLVCEAPEVASIQPKIDAVNQDLRLAQRQLALDQDTLYSNPNYIQDTAGQAWVQEQLDYLVALQAEKAQLEEQLAAAKGSQTVDDSQPDEQPPGTEPTSTSPTTTPPPMR